VTPDAPAKPQAEAKPAAEPAAQVDTPDVEVTPQLIKRVHSLYETLGRADVRAVEASEEKLPPPRKDDDPK
jgi:hypothetical protein